MADRYLSLTGTAPGRFLTRRLGLPQPAALTRWTPEHPTLDGDLLHLTAGKSGLDLAHTGLRPTKTAEKPAAVLLDATGIRDVEGLAEVHAALHPVLRSVAESGRVVVLGAPLDPADHHQAAAQQALEGFTRSLGKEIGRGRTVNLVRLTDAAAAESTLRFLLSPKSAYVSGQLIEVGDAQEADVDWDLPLAGRTALVTGGARGIGAAVAGTLARDGARVVVLDVPAALADAEKLAERLGGSALALDITAADAGERIAAALPDGLDVLVHNAGITRDRRLVNMPAERWSSVLEVNLASVALLAHRPLKRRDRIAAPAGKARTASRRPGIGARSNGSAARASPTGPVGPSVTQAGSPSPSRPGTGQQEPPARVTRPSGRWSARSQDLTEEGARRRLGAGRACDTLPYRHYVPLIGSCGLLGA
ncbi:SDR family oxidoreductase [Streptomyces fulvoviolaceus]|uniref:SDR family oxidoreductase n=1 Tax=Streptomyces fulvoviolaceus TaxID=285535 RepID=UPI0028F71565|nr:SDR family oxidoreductase [Streptomyces fulvoviolaceus]